MKALVLTQREWNQLHDEIAKHRPRSVLMLRSKMKEVLGFTVREHKHWVPKMDGGYYDLQIHLDFYDESKRTMFLLRYSDFLLKKNIDIE